MSPLPAELIATLVARRRVIDARERARGARLRERAGIITRRLREEGAIDGAWLVGSLAWGSFGERSDVDVVVRGTDPSRIGALWGTVSDALDAEVDLLRLEDLPESFARRVLAEGVRLDEP